MDEGMLTEVVRSHREFLQTALFVDDRALERDFDFPPQDVIDPEGPDLATAHEHAAPPIRDEEYLASEGGPPDAQNVSRTNELVEALADHGVTCSVLAPRALETSDIDRVRKLARRTDLLILDWNLGQGATSAKLIQEVLKSDYASGGRLRLVVVYTAETGLPHLAAELEQALSASGIVALTSDEGSTVTGDRFRVSFVRKRQAGIEYVGLESGIEPAELAEHVLGQFDALVGGGLLQQMALKTLAAVRDQAQHLLSRFDSSLDAAFIGHRAQTSHREAVLFCLELLGSELAALVRSADISAMLSSAMVGDRIEELLGDRIEARHWNPKTDTFKEGVSAATVRNFLASSDDVSRSAAGVSKNDWSVSSFLVDDGSSEIDLRDSVTRVEQGFALLSTLVRTSKYDDSLLAAPTLELGVVLRDISGNYLLCIQPLCDSVRVTHDEGKQFLFLPLSRSGHDLAFELLIWDDGPVPLHPGTIGGSSEVHFQGDGAARVVKSVRSADGWCFRASDGSVFSYVGTVREARCRRIVQRLVENLTRVGLDEPFLMLRNEFRT